MIQMIKGSLLLTDQKIQIQIILSIINLKEIKNLKIVVLS